MQTMAPVKAVQAHFHSKFNKFCGPDLFPKISLRTFNANYIQAPIMLSYFDGSEKALNTIPGLPRTLIKRQFQYPDF